MQKAIRHAASAKGDNMEIRNNDFKLQLREGSVREFEKVVLSSGLCDLFMPMGFVSCEDGELVSYHCSGYTALRQLSITEIKEALDILEKTFLLVSRAGEYLITPSRITLDLDTIFYSKETGGVKVAYVPVDNPAASLRENMTGFITEMEKGVYGNNRLYLEKIKTHLEENNYYINDIIDLIGELKREIYP